MAYILKKTQEDFKEIATHVKSTTNALSIHGSVCIKYGPYIEAGYNRYYKESTGEIKKLYVTLLSRLNTSMKQRVESMPINSLGYTRLISPTTDLRIEHDMALFIEKREFVNRYITQHDHEYAYLLKQFVTLHDSHFRKFEVYKDMTGNNDYYLVKLSEKQYWPLPSTEIVGYNTAKEPHNTDKIQNYQCIFSVEFNTWRDLVRMMNHYFETGFINAYGMKIWGTKYPSDVMVVCTDDN